ncbi:hypothetical protein [Nostoc sp. 'Peltigera malacea cyanobiont' DB3992]|uniref:hypothetical protein n=1 Tax=Nostoc sp. 'Peltigera malacea cyanobiont' DB3992 TaxID=1206980 RepID=UPI000C03942F|nr:hypothetical protein [Nostoc sp. 'Peltigera malacea cyanobiont' DB3992]PHM06473.1 hypothetical protein CK516_33320 [Nostoc sp. 'Peltigera malacea cyanobiont' DB3992]
MKLNSSVQLGCVLVSSSSLAAVFIGLSGTSAFAQITIQSTGTLSGTIQLPRNNPNFNQRITRVDTDDTGTYSRNLGTKNNPNYVPIYKSDYVQVKTRADGSLHYFVDFKGIPIVSFNGVLTSPILSGGELTPYKYQGQLAGTTFQGVVQDEFNLTKALYTGIVTDPNTGNQYQGTFEVSGYGVRYSDAYGGLRLRNGSATPTVFDFKSDLPGSPKVTSLEMTNAPLAKIQIKVPATATLITPTPTTGNGSTTTPPPVSSGGSTPTPPPVISGGSTSIPPSVIDGSAIAPTPVVSGGSTPTPATIVDGGNTFTVTPIVDGGNTFTVTPIVDSGASSTPTTYTSGSNSPSISTTPNMELSNGNFLEVNQVVVNPATLAQAACSQDSAKSCTITSPKQAIGPRSRVLLR